MRAGNYPIGKPNMFPFLQIVFRNPADPENERAKLRIAEYRAKSRQLFLPSPASPKQLRSSPTSRTERSLIMGARFL
jgi:hypothetical protein